MKTPILVLLFLLLFTPEALAQANDLRISESQSIINTDSMLPQGFSCKLLGRITKASSSMNKRLFRDAQSSVCSTNKPFPGETLSAVKYNVHQLKNTTALPQCVTIYAATEENDYIHLTAYKENFNPMMLSQNYMGDIGSSFANGYPRTMQVALNPGESLVLVVNMISVDGEMTKNYQLDIMGLSCRNINNIEIISQTSKQPTFSFGQNKETIIIQGISVQSAMVFDSFGNSFNISLKGNTLDIKHFPKGFYLLKIIDMDGNTFSKKMIKN